MGSPTPNRTLELLILQPQGGTFYTAVQKDPIVRPIAINTLNTFTVQIPMQAGDVLGLFAPGGQPGGLTSCAFNLAGQTLRASSTLGEPPIGTPVDYNLQFATTLNASAEFHPDADGDFFDDGSADNCVGTPGAFGGCPSTVTLGAATAKKGKVSLTATVPGVGTLRAGAANDATLASTAKGASLKQVSLTLSANTQQAVPLTLPLTKRAKQRLAQKGKLKVTVKAAYTPLGGPPGTAIAQAKFKRKLKKKR
jgi:hypothetical protein